MPWVVTVLRPAQPRAHGFVDRLVHSRWTFARVAAKQGVPAMRLMPAAPTCAPSWPG